MDIPTVSQSASMGLDFERTRVELATFRIAMANASFTSKAELLNFAEKVKPDFISLTENSDYFSEKDIQVLHDPNNPLADPDGLVYRLNVDPTHEMATLVSASRAYEANVRAYNVNSELSRAALNIGSNK